MDLNTAYGIMQDMLMEKQAKKDGRPYTSWVREYVEKMYESGPAPMQALLNSAKTNEAACRPVHKLTSLGRCVPIPPELVR